MLFWNRQRKSQSALRAFTFQADWPAGSIGVVVDRLNQQQLGDQVEQGLIVTGIVRGVGEMPAHLVMRLPGPDPQGILTLRAHIGPLTGGLFRWYEAQIARI